MDTTIKKAPAATGASFQNFNDKEFYTYRAQLALGGHMLSRSNPKDGKTVYFCSKWGMVRQFNELSAVGEFLRQIGGAV
jgi:hypothetical protein